MWYIPDRYIPDISVWEYIYLIVTAILMTMHPQFIHSIFQLDPMDDFNYNGNLAEQNLALKEMVQRLLTIHHEFTEKSESGSVVYS